MNIGSMIELLPDSVKVDIINFTTVKLRTGQIAERITLDRLLTDDEKQTMQSNKRIIGVDCTAQHRYAPEIKRNYFYIVQED